MTFVTVLRRSLLLPSFVQQGDDKSRPSKSKKVWSHTVGGNDAAPFGREQNEAGHPGPEGNRNFDKRGGRELQTISPGEVENALSLYQNQLLPTDDGALIRKHSFYTIPLRRNFGAPSFIFGRVKVAMPSDGHIQDVNEVELAFPKLMGTPERVVFEPGDVNLREAVQSYRIRVKVYGTKEDQADFQRYERKFGEAGFTLEFNDNFVELLELNLIDRESVPWFHVIGSRWFAGIPHSWQDTVRRMLYRLSAHETLLINYHPRHVQAGVYTLNDELDFQHRLTEFYLTDPRTPEQTHYIIRTLFDKIFSQPEKKASYLSNRQELLEP